MKKLMKPLVVLFAIAVSTGAYSQQDKPGKALKNELKTKEITVHPAVTPRVRVKHFVVKNRDADIQRIIRQKGLTVAEVK
ncbi:MAG: hypothetical protein DCO96_06805 [Fluviicola sp. XM-24bin1]|nr:MAG: hypothetical protein DCO96_06805 [Fluviicola sp. XM-24bin1]